MLASGAALQREMETSAFTPLHSLSAMQSTHAETALTVALVNPKSGERASANFLLEELNRLLPGRVVDLSTCLSDNCTAIQLLQSAVNGIVIVGGGDGTVSWVMDMMESIDWRDTAPAGESRRPHIAVIPMGTGNDLSRSLGFGSGFAHITCCCGCSGCCRVHTLEKTLGTALAASKTTLDRWKIDVVAGNGTLIDSRIMNNYFSIGFDASIARKFHHFRNENPKYCESRAMNKVWYGCFGCGALCGEPKLGKTVALSIDGHVVTFPEEVKSLVVANVDSFAGGVQLWSDKKKRFAPVSISDGKVEVQGIFGAFHMGMMQMKMRNAHKIGQGSVIQFHVSAVHFMQWDGEAMEKVVMPCTVTVTHHSALPVLSHRGIESK